uniref:Chemokine interleukin-8-like domain-containing protein n=1 Tax=Stegastes partitus TaxID=144197 RepID=A0A3B5ANC7_9TELE
LIPVNEPCISFSCDFLLWNTLSKYTPSLSVPSGRHPGGKSRMCCVEVSRANVSSSVTDNKYHEQPAKDPCVHAIILTTTNRRKVCADPTAKWVQTLIANMTKV